MGVLEGLRSRRSWLIAKEQAAYALYRARRSRAGQPRVVIFAQGRTGSTLLENLIASTGHLEAKGEVLASDTHEVRDPLGYVIGLSRRSPAGFVCHVKIYQLTRDRTRPVDPAAFLRGLHADGWTILYLRRADRLRHVVSSLVAEARGDYHKRDDRSENLTLRVDCDRAANFIRARERNEAAERAALAGLPFHEVVYERDLERPDRHQATADAIMRALGLPPAEVRATYRKVTDTPLPSLIENFDELAARLRELGLDPDRQADASVEGFADRRPERKDDARAQAAVQPPSMTWVCPVTNADSSEAM